MNKKILFLALLGVLVLPTLAAAATLQGMSDAAAQTALYVATGVVIVLWVLTGILFLTAQGEPATLNKAKMALLAAVIGTVVIIIASTGADTFVKSIFGL